MGKVDCKKYGPCEWVALGIVGAVLIGLGAYFFPAFRSLIGDNATAAWVQAIGSIGAIGAAIEVGRRQYATGLRLQHMQEQRETRKQQEAERAEVSRVLQAIHDEIEVRWAQFEEIIGAHLDACSEAGGRMFAVYNLMPVELFPVYRSLVGRLPLIADRNLRRGIVRCYARMEGLVLTVETNSELAKKYLDATAEADTISRTTERLIAIRIAEERLCSYFEVLVGARCLVKKDVEALLRAFPSFAG